jgi:hypothetical protein
MGLTTCAAVATVAKNGVFNTTFCPTVQAIVEDPCGCEVASEAPSPQPTVSLEPTKSPTRRPTQAPVTPPPNSSAGSAVVWIALASVFIQPLVNMVW